MGRGEGQVEGERGGGGGEVRKYPDKDTRPDFRIHNSRKTYSKNEGLLGNCLRHCLIEFGGAWRAGWEPRWVTGHYVVC